MTPNHYNFNVFAPEFVPLIDDLIARKCRIQNVGDKPGEEIVQLYIRDLGGEVTRPVKELKGFQKIWLEPKDSKIVCFEIPVNELGFHGLDMSYKIESGEFKV